MGREGYIALTFGIVILLAALFIVLFFLYKRMKKPEGCENLEHDPSICSACSAEALCPMKKLTKEKENSQEETNNNE